MRKIYYLLLIIAIDLLAFSCANRAAGPTGGPKDEIPPKVMRSTPFNGALNFTKKEIQLVFDENITIEKVTENVVISPPQSKQPDVKGNAKVITVSFEDNLLDSTTYTINFGDAIVDLNEKNPLKNYRFSFSTGNEIDTLKISGILINAEDLNPVQNVIIGIYKENEAENFTQKPFLRIGKTDENGHFVIDNVKAGKYKVYALGDANNDYYFQPGESLAFSDSILTPTFRIEEMKDTVWKDSAEIDSVRTFMGTHFLPDNILLSYFKESKKRQYFVKYERKQAQSFTLFFNTKLDILPIIKPLNYEWEGKYLLQKNITKDTLTYWITDTSVYNIDTLSMTITYFKTDSAFNLVATTDTANVFMRKAKINQRARQPIKTDTKPIIYNFTNNANGSFDVYNSIIFRFESPLDNVDLKKIKLSHKVDTILKPLPVKWRQIDSTTMVYAIDYKWEPDKSYQITTDSAAFKSIYNQYSDKFTGQFKVKTLDEYSSIKMVLSNYDSLVVFQVLDTKDAVLATKPAVLKGTLFEYLKPGDYFLRAFIDSNRNGLWDTGNLNLNRQPEKVFYYSKKLSLRANWEFKETWDLNSQQLLMQKPAELKKSLIKNKGGD